jgi:hypothetical protein
MRTKTLLLSAAAMVAGALGAQAQSNVYSANVVGYVSVPLQANTFYLAATPLNGATNDLENLLQALPVKSSVQIWNGAGFTPSTKGAGGWTVNFSVPPGTGYFISSPSAVTNSFVGSVVVGFGGSVTNALPAGLFQLVGSPIPFNGTLNDTNLGLAAMPVKSSVQVWNGNGFTPSTKGAGGWTVDLPIIPGQGFFLTAATATNWVQTLPATP